MRRMGELTVVVAGLAISIAIGLLLALMFTERPIAPVHADTDRDWPAEVTVVITATPTITPTATYAPTPRPQPTHDPGYCVDAKPGDVCRKPPPPPPTPTPLLNCPEARADSMCRVPYAPTSAPLVAP